MKKSLRDLENKHEVIQSESEGKGMVSELRAPQTGSAGMPLQGEETRSPTELCDDMLILCLQPGRRGFFSSASASDVPLRYISK